MMLDLVHSVPENPVRRYLQLNAVPEQAALGVGYIYVISFSGPSGYSKVGSTGSPCTRLLTLYYAGRAPERAFAGVWLSPAHPDFRLIEKRALANCRTVSPSSTARSEYFPGLAFKLARREAAKAAYGFRPLPASRRLPAPQQSAAGQYEALPHPLRRIIEDHPPDPGDAFEAYLNRRARFAQGTARGRFLRRNDPAELSGDLIPLAPACDQESISLTSELLSALGALGGRRPRT